MASQSSKEIIFIYNADKGFVNGLMDSVHKLVSPNTYACDLCAITHGFAGPKKQWASFIKELAIPVIFYHKNDRPEEFSRFDLPIILLKSNEGIQTLMSKKEMIEFNEVNIMIDSLRIKLNLK